MKNNWAACPKNGNPSRHHGNNALSRMLVILALLLAAMLLGTASAQENPYIVTYDHYLEEPGNLEVELVHQALAPYSSSTQ